MKKILLLALFGTLLFACASSNPGGPETRYFDENNVEISKSKFNKIRSTNELLDIPGDSANHRKLTVRENRGKINDRPLLESRLETAIGEEIDSNKPIIIIYHPGKTVCDINSNTTEWLENWYGQLEEGLDQIAQVEPIYLYKDREGLFNSEEVLDWTKDPEGTIENLFFEHDYDCSSFVVISKEGDYISYFGEFPKEFVWEATEIMENKSMVSSSVKP